MIEKTVSELARALSTGSVSSVELTQAFIDRITSIDTQLNSYITVDEEAALRQARQADDARSRGTDTLLLGIPIAHKDLFCTQGTKTTCGSKMLFSLEEPIANSSQFVLPNVTAPLSFNRATTVAS